MKRRLYHFPTSPFSRRARLALAHKRLDVELADARADPSKLEEARRLCATKTIPILVEPDGRALGDSTAIAHYLDRAHPGAPRIVPDDAPHAFAALEAATLVDVALNTLVDLGTRYYPLRESAGWPTIKGEMLGRAQAALDALAKRAADRSGRTWTDFGWCIADAWVVTAIMWIEGWPARAPQNQNIAQLVTLGAVLPAELSRWTDAHRARPDVVALG